MKDMKAEDEALKKYIEKCRIEKWFEEAMDLARRSIEDELNEATEDGQIMREIAEDLRELEREIASEGQKLAWSILQPKPRQNPKAKLNGTKKILRSADSRH